MNLDQQRIRLCKEMQDPIALPSLESILSYVVTSNKDIEKIESERNQFKTVCGKSIQQNQISFQCFDCTLDAHHMYCGKCFIPEYHKGHKAIMRHNIGGCCDCGDNQTIPSPDSFCKDHKGFYVNLQSELQPTIAHLKQPIRNFIKMALEIYHIRMQSVKDSNIDYNLSIIYNHIWEYDFQIVMEAFKGQNEMVELFEKLWTCAHIYYVVMTLINYLSNNSMPFIMLLSQLLMEENEDEITYFEMIIRNQCLLEDYKLTNRIQFEQILYTLHGNLKFKQFMQQKYLQNYNRLYKFKEIVESRQEKLIQKMSIEIKLKEFMDQNLQIQYRNIIVDHIQQLQMREKTMLKYVDCLFIQHHTQFISEQFQQEFQNSRYIKNLFNSAEILYQQLIDSVIENPLNANQFQSVYHLRLEYPYFKKILIAQLEKQLGENINIFKTELVNNLLLKQFPLSDWNQFKILGIAKQATWGQFNLQFRLEELRLQATGFLYQKSLYSNFAVNSLSRILDEVNNQIFQINIVRAHYSFLTNLMRNKEKFDIEMAYIKLRELPTIEQVNRYSFFYYQIIKNDNLLEYHFAQFSIIMFYYETTDFDKNKYLQKIKEVTGLNEEQIYQLNQAVIQKLLIEYVAIKELINTLPYLNNLYTQYEGGEESYESLESICLGFIRLFVYVYGQEGLNYVLDRLSVCLPLNLNFLLSHLLLSLIQSNIDQYNVMRYFYQAQLPQVFQDSINKFARNSFILKKQQSIIDITQYLRQLKAISNKNFSEYIKQTSEYDHQSGELKLKYGITQIYDPGLYLDSDKLKSNVFESLGEKRNEHINTILGNSVEEEMENFNNLDPIRQEIIRTILEYDQLDKVIEQSIYSSYVQGGEQFMFILNYLVRYLQFVKKLPQNEIREIVLKYQELFNNAEMQTIKQIEQCFKFFLQDLLKDQEAIEEQSKVVQKQQLKLQNLKEKFKNKMAKFEQQITNDAEQPQQIVENQIICYYCKQLIDDNSRACYPAQIKFTNIYDYFSFLDDSLQRYLNKKLNSTKIQLQCCSHILHVKCSNELIQNLILHGQLIQMNWISKKCITCQLPINIFFPYITNKNKQNDVVTGEVCKWFKENLIKFLRRDEIFMKMNDTEVLFTFYVNIVTDFTIKMFQDVDDFINKENSQYFETIFNTFQILFAQDYQTAKQLLQGYEKLKVDTDAELRLIYHILSSTLSQQGLPLTIEFSDYEQKIQKILGNSIKLPQLQLPKVIVTAQEIKNIIQKKLIYELGESYDQFYFKHFYKKCTKCQSYPQRMKDYNNYSYEEMYVCLICFDILCRSACGETPTSPPYRGNLNTHAETKHKKDCIYLSIQSGGVALHSSYVILMNQRYLYSDELGVLINPNSPLKQNWKNFKLDMKTLSEISDMIYYQSIRQKIKQYQVNNQFFRIDGSI
ncbi:hypothetical protein pb186bvf_004852 [Paramecium bursaria]